MNVTREQFVGATYKELLAENDRLWEENDKLVKVLHEVESEAIDAYLGLQHDCELLVGELDDRFRKYWHEQCENEKLRELVVRMFHTIEWSDRMSDSMYWPSFSYKRELRELGVEVPE